MQESIDMRGQLTLRLTDTNGHIFHQQHYKNRIVKTGRKLVAEMFAGITAGTLPTKVTHMAVGTDGTDPNDDQETLLAERSPRKPLSEVQYSEFVENPGTAQEVKRWRTSLTAVFEFEEANGTQPLREAAIFNAETGGVMYNRVVFDPVTKTNAFKLTLLWDIIF